MTGRSFEFFLTPTESRELVESLRASGMSVFKVRGLKGHEGFEVEELVENDTTEGGQLIWILPSKIVAEEVREIVAPQELGGIVHDPPFLRDGNLRSAFIGAKSEWRSGSVSYRNIEALRTFSRVVRLFRRRLRFDVHSRWPGQLWRLLWKRRASLGAVELVRSGGRLFCGALECGILLEPNDSESHELESR